MVLCLLGAASKYQMVSYDQETNAISATSSYSQDISDEVLHTKTLVKYIPLRVADQLNSNNSLHSHLTCHDLDQLHNSQ